MVENPYLVRVCRGRARDWSSGDRPFDLSYRLFPVVLHYLFEVLLMARYGKTVLLICLTVGDTSYLYVLRGE